MTSVAIEGMVEKDHHSLGVGRVLGGGGRIHTLSKTVTTDATLRVVTCSPPGGEY